MSTLGSNFERLLIGVAALGAGLALAALTTTPPAPPGAAFRADQIVTHANGATQRLYRVWAERDRVRLEQTHKHGDLISIHRRDLGKLWTLVPHGRVYVEETLNTNDFASPLLLAGTVVSNVEEQVEEVNGFVCRKRCLKPATRFNGVVSSTGVFEWVTLELPFPVRIRRADGSVSALVNVRREALPPELFEVPAGYSRTNDLMDVLMTPAPDDENPPRTQDFSPKTFNVKRYRWSFGVP